jgi:hypothetical protein
VPTLVGSGEILGQHRVEIADIDAPDMRQNAFEAALTTRVL